MTAPRSRGKRDEAESPSAEEAAAPVELGRNEPEESECRVCRGPAEPDNPLCVCPRETFIIPNVGMRRSVLAIIFEMPPPPRWVRGTPLASLNTSKLPTLFVRFV